MKFYYFYLLIIFNIMLGFYTLVIRPELPYIILNLIVCNFAGILIPYLISKTPDRNIDYDLDGTKIYNSSGQPITKL